MQNKLKTIYISFIVIFSLLASTRFGHAGIIFEDNFDDQPVWTVTQSPDDRITCYPTSECATPPPIGYAGYTVQASPYDPVGHNTININSDNHRGETGQGVTMWNESGSTSYWWSDGLLAIKLPSAYHELYVRFYIKFQPNWEWSNIGESIFQKFFRISHTSDYSKLFTMKPINQPMVITDLYKGNGGQSDLAISNAYREEPSYYMLSPYNSSSKSYFGNGTYGGTGSGFFDSGLGDGNWHCWEFRIKINSAPGEWDGIHEFWQDGLLVHSKNDIPWIGPGGDMKLWNTVMLGGNSHNHFAETAEAKEQWHAFDDLIISTTPIGCGFLKDVR